MQTERADFNIVKPILLIDSVDSMRCDSPHRYNVYSQNFNLISVAAFPPPQFDLRIILFHTAISEDIAFLFLHPHALCLAQSVSSWVIFVAVWISHNGWTHFCTSLIYPPAILSPLLMGVGGQDKGG